MHTPFRIILKRGIQRVSFYYDQWPSIDHMQKIAADNNLPETAFILPRGSDHSEWDIRWFTPIKEVPLCGHATLASAAVLDQVFSYSPQSLNFMLNVIFWR